MPLNAQFILQKKIKTKKRLKKKKISIRIKIEKKKIIFFLSSFYYYSKFPKHKRNTDERIFLTKGFEVTK